LKFGNFSEITVFIELAKISQKKFGKKFRKNFLFLGQKNLFLIKKFEKIFETPVLGLNTAVSENSKLTKIQNLSYSKTFPKLQKNDIKLKLRKLQKTRYNLKTGLNVWFKVRNAGP